MRQPVDAQTLRRFMQVTGRVARDEGDCYFAGGATAILLGWRGTTVDIDIRLEPEQDAVLRALPALKNELRVNVELASPGEFVPLPSGWRDRSAFVAREGRLTFRNFDLYAQALAKLERSHERDRADVAEMLERRLVDRDDLRARFDEIRPELFRFPAVDPKQFEANVLAVTG